MDHNWNYIIIFTNWEVRKYCYISR